MLRMCNISQLFPFKELAVLSVLLAVLGQVVKESDLQDSDVYWPDITRAHDA